MPFRWILDEGQPPSGCLDQLDFDAWIDFVFNHLPPKKGGERWYSLDDFSSYYYKDAEAVLQRLGRAFRECDSLLGRYTSEQVKQGLWSFITAFELPDLLEDPKVSLEARLECLGNLPSAYERLLSREGFEKIAFTYWDPLTHPFSEAFGGPTSPDLLRIQDAMFEGLNQILHLRPKICFLAAARGLGQLRHEHGSDAIQAALSGRDDLTIFEYSYGLACMRGEVGMRIPIRFS
jgi:hypothetical protein